MNKKHFNINGIPAVLWGDQAEKLILAVHGNMSNKEDAPISLLAKLALPKGYQVLSFDLPDHGERSGKGELCKVQNCAAELGEVMKYARNGWDHISLFANSIGAYFSLMAYGDEVIDKALFLSPVVDMKRLIENMMTWFQISEEQLKKDQEIPTPMGQTLYWDYYCYVNEHPVERWEPPTSILYGSLDNLCERGTVTRFTEKFACDLRIASEAEHFFHTAADLEAIEQWLTDNL